MKIRKLHTIDSTNTYLKDWARKELLENFTTVVATKQTQGRGQRGNYWLSEEGKNLTFSILIRVSNFKATRQFELNQAVSLGLLKALQKNILADELAFLNLQVKWPNDIMAENKKIAGILIENTLNKQHIKHSIVGIGLNVNQTNFPSTLPVASSLKNNTQKEFDLEKLLHEIILAIKETCSALEQGKSLEKEYLKNLYLFDAKANYKDANNQIFEGKITGITPEGKLQICTTDNVNRSFGFKEIVFL